jgi:glycosyltransferase involved in cell wall biosynthesis
MKVAIVHDWLTGMRGGEAVLESILDIYPDADLFTLLHNPGTVSARIENRKISTSFIDRLPFKASKYRWYLPLFPTAIELFDFHGYDLIVSSSHCVARGIIPPPHVPHVCYFHSPMRYVWDLFQQYFPPRGFANRFVIPFFANYLRMWDAAARDRVDRYLCNSAFVAERIRRYYGKQAVVVPPPCIADEQAIKIAPPAERGDFYLIVSAFVPYKRLDLAIEACLLRGAHLKIVGGGPEDKNLRRLARKGERAESRIEFLGQVDSGQIRQLYSQATALLFPGEEDFGIVPVEAQARGCPVIAYGSGGALETVLATPKARTGFFFAEQTVAALSAAMDLHERARYRSADFRRNVVRFTAAEFQKKMIRQIAETCRQIRPGKKTAR